MLQCSILAMLAAPRLSKTCEVFRVLTGYRLPRRVAVVDVPPSHIPGMAAYARHMDGADEDERVSSPLHGLSLPVDPALSCNRKATVAVSGWVHVSLTRRTATRLTDSSCSQVSSLLAPRVRRRHLPQTAQSNPLVCRDPLG